jgi:hypothetical protein
MKVSIQDAAKYSNVTIKTIYYRIGRGHLPKHYVKVVKEGFIDWVTMVDTDDLDSIYYSTRAGEKQHAAHAKRPTQFWVVIYQNEEGEIISGSKKFISRDLAVKSYDPNIGKFMGAIVV